MLPRMSGLCTVQLTTDGTATIDNDEVSILVRHGVVTKLPRLPSNTKLTVGLHSTATWSEPDTPQDRYRNAFSLPSPSDLEPAENAVDQGVGHHGTERQVEHGV